MKDTHLVYPATICLVLYSHYTNSTILSLLLKALFLSHSAVLGESIQVLTDGSKIGSGVGALLFSPIVISPILFSLILFSSELAIMIAFSRILFLNYNHFYINYSDSISALHTPKVPYSKKRNGVRYIPISSEVPLSQEANLMFLDHLSRGVTDNETIDSHICWSKFKCTLFVILFKIQFKILFFFLFPYFFLPFPPR